MKLTEIEELADKLERRGFKDRELAVRNLYKCDIYFISELNRVLK